MDFCRGTVLARSGRTSLMKRSKSTKRIRSKVPERIIPIVDAVVEMVFARLEEAAAKAKRAKDGKGAAGASDTASPHHDGLAGALADLLLAGLTHQPETKKKRKKQLKKQKAKAKERRKSRA